MPKIVIGSCPMTADDLTRIKQETGVSAVLSLQHDDCLSYWGIDYTQLQNRAAELGLTLVRCPIRDFDIPDMRRQLPLAIKTLASLQTEGHRTYVHCTAGIGRSALVVLGYLTLVETCDPEEAISLILASRSDAVPSWEAYFSCRYDLAARNRKAIERRAYELYEHGENGNADADWQQAEREILRNMLLRQIKSAK
ncbi:MAG: dual specificity protein phosphatase family protein [Candidatus Thiodiazotropha sp. (ex Dulcina madagascariensis)]|nr:dual specificity protein phosphatase family protein [Candidatus Thiodiazotropha sp. (ex Dulcina madagascariensis)]